MNIRQAYEKDAQTLAAIQVAAWKAAYQDVLPESWWTDFTEDRWERQFQQSIIEQTEEITVAEAGQQVRGYTVIGACRDADLNNRTVGEIWGLYVSPDHWKQGIGTALTNWACRELASRGYAVITLWVFDSNQNARQFYEHRSFFLDGSRKEMPPPLPPAVRYRKAQVKHHPAQKS
jgi:ribosomal protein S18 acetylase RimI-like enzyme